MKKNLKNYLFKEKKSFAKGICFDKLFIIFLIASIIGSFYEEIFSFVLTYSKTGNMVWEYRRGVIYGPFNVIYGFGAIIIISLLAEKNHKWYQTIFYGALLGGGIEYFVGFLQQTFTNSISWDYSNRLLNINGRTTIPYMFVWGIFSLLFVKYLYPFLSSKIEKIPYNLGKLIVNVLLVFMVINMAISWSAIIRQNLRNNNIPAMTSYGKFLDKYYDDELMRKYFPNMSFVKGE